MKLNTVGMYLMEADEDDSFDAARPKVTVEFVNAMKRRKDSLRHEAIQIGRDIEQKIKMMPHYRPWNYPGGATALLRDINGGQSILVSVPHDYSSKAYIVPVTPNTSSDVNSIREQLSRAHDIVIITKQLQTKIARDQRTLKLRATQRQI